MLPKDNETNTLKVYVRNTQNITLDTLIKFLSFAID